MQNQKHTFYKILSHQKANISHFNILPHSLLLLAGNYDVEKRCSPQFSKFSQGMLRADAHNTPADHCQSQSNHIWERNTGEHQASLPTSVDTAILRVQLIWQALHAKA